MKRFKNILVVIDGGKPHEAMIHRAFELALNNQAQLCFIEVMEEIPKELQGYFKDITSKDFQEIAFRENHSRLQEILGPFSREGLQHVTKVLIGKPFMEIIREVLRNRIDLVMITQEQERGLRENVFGSTALHLLRKCPCPVWIIKREQGKLFKKILVAIDPTVNPDDKDAASKDELCIKLLQIGSSLAISETSDIYIFHAWSVLHEDWMQSRAGITAQEIELIRQNTKTNHVRQIEDLIARYAPNVSRRDLHIVRGDAGRLIPEMAREKEIDLIVMGTVGRTGLSGMLIGNTAEKILRHIACSVLAVKPNGFRSPVKLGG
jgi:nucleotide-binding universal stress UspA family protein